MFVVSLQNDTYARNYNTKIRIGANSAVGYNALCRTIDLTGIYDCTNPLTGTYIELRRTDATNEYYTWLEIRAYEHKPFALTTSMMSSNDVANISFANALSFSMTKGTTGTEALTNDAYFNGNNCPAANCFLKVDFGASLDIKAVLVVGRRGYS